MKITHYLYNAFIIEWDDKKLAIDPGALLAYWFSFAPLIPKEEWNDITHIFVTHGDPDHYWHADRVMKASGAPIIFNKTMIQQKNAETFMLGPRSKGLAFDTPVSNFHTLSADEIIEVDEMKIRGIKTTHGPLTIKLGLFKKTEYPEKNERLGWGALGFEIICNGKTIVNLGDSLLEAKEWKKIKTPDVLMIPIGGGQADNTMDEFEALEAIKIVQPKLVIPMHYDLPVLFSKHYASVDEAMFKREVEEMDMDCKILKKGQTVVINQ
jgi:L-ascorbate metabolism protein UlaG (beta-lactamase superfamily)